MYIMLYIISFCQFKLHTSPKLNSYEPVQPHSDVQDGQPTAIRSANQNLIPTSHFNEAPPSDINNQSESTQAMSRANQSSSQKQVAFATGKLWEESSLYCNVSDNRLPSYNFS